MAAFLKKSDASSMLLLVDGAVIFDWGNTRKKHLIHSMRKCLLNSLIGIAVSDGKIDTSQTLRELDIQDIGPRLSEHELNARVADLLKSRSGVFHNAAAVSQGMLKEMPARESYSPGEHYYYNNWDFNTLGAILEQQTGKSIYELFHTQIAQPLGMRDYKGKYTTIDGESKEFVAMPKTDGFYQFEKSKSKYPAYHFRMSSRDLALYGQLYLNNGKWNGRQIIPKTWIEASTRPYSIYNKKYHLAYGMLWRIRLTEDNKLRAFFHTGVGIHMLAVYPEEKMVLVHRVDTENEYHYNGNDIYRMLDLVFDAKLK
ncbi:serine hydrolase domain-containing protein [Maribellus maritimus]|uniref:serine hydrolase domain-containing protein n=1 Tax=Maribellus maritimus TaxID=2870838 RepID=UPI001EEA7A21|nr:serine hydrolase [Maribellus maritimus]MCG6187854.1 beta-lactamase family protein [Maribellus maritimus]